MFTRLAGDTAPERNNHPVASSGLAFPVTTGGAGKLAAQVCSAVRGATAGTAAKGVTAPAERDVCGGAVSPLSTSGALAKEPGVFLGNFGDVWRSMNASLRSF